MFLQELRPKGLDVQQEELGDLVDKEMAATAAAIEAAATRIEVRWLCMRVGAFNQMTCYPVASAVGVGSPEWNQWCQQSLVCYMGEGPLQKKSQLCFLPLVFQQVPPNLARDSFCKFPLARGGCSTTSLFSWEACPPVSPCSHNILTAVCR